MTTDKQKIGRFSYVLASLVFVPVVGLFLAPIVIVLGLVKWKKGGVRLIYVGLGGVLFNVVVAMGINTYTGHQRNGQYLAKQDTYVKHILPGIVETIEIFKVYEGRYPVSLETFRPESAQGNEIRLDQETIDRLHYQVVEGGKHYLLVGIGADNKPFTADDIVPAVDLERSGEIGLLLKR